MFSLLNWLFHRSKLVGWSAKPKLLLLTVELSLKLKYVSIKFSLNRLRRNIYRIVYLIFNLDKKSRLYLDSFFHHMSSTVSEIKQTLSGRFETILLYHKRGSGFHTTRTRSLPAGGKYVFRDFAEQDL